MGSSRAFFVLFFLVLFASTIDGRKCPEDHWKTVMKSEPIPEVISDLLHQGRASDSNVKPIKEFDIRPNAIIYHSDIHSKNKVKPIKDFDIRPNLIIYHGHGDSRNSESLS